MNWWQRIIILFAALMVMRLGVATALDTLLDISKNADIYGSLASNLAEGNGFVHTAGDKPVLWRAPLYPAFLAGLFFVFGAENELAVLIAQSALDATTALLIWWIGTRLFSSRVGLAAAALYAAYPLSAYFSLRMLPEPLFTLGLVSFVAVLMKAMERPRVSIYGLLGVVGGLVTLIKPVTIALIPFLALAILVQRHRALVSALPYVFGMVTMLGVTVFPWTLRNYLVSGQFVPVATGGGYSLWTGNHLSTAGREDDELEGELLQNLLNDRAAIGRAHERAKDKQDQSTTADLNQVNPHGTFHIEPGLDRAFGSAALEELKSHPLETLALMARKFFRFWFSVYQIENRWAQSWIYIAQGLLLFLTLYGFLQAYRANIVIFPFIIVILYMSLVYTVTLATLRYSIPLIPLLINFAVFAAMTIMTKTKRKAYNRRNPPDHLANE